MFDKCCSRRVNKGFHATPIFIDLNVSPSSVLSIIASPGTCLSCLNFKRTRLKVVCSTSLSLSLPGDPLRNNDVVITSKRCHFDVITCKWHRFHVITTFLLRHVFGGTVFLHALVIILNLSLEHYEIVIAFYSFPSIDLEPHFFHKIILISVRFGLWSMWFHITFKCIAIGVRNGQETSRFQNQSELSSDRKPGFVQRINTCPCKSLSAPASHQNNRSPLWKEAPFTISHI